MTNVVLVLVLVALVAAFGGLYRWARRSEQTIDYDRPGLSEEQGNALRFGIAVGSSQGINGGV